MAAPVRRRVAGRVGRGATCRSVRIGVLHKTFGHLRSPLEDASEPAGFPSRLWVAGHHWSGKEVRTWLACWPQPVQVGLPQVRHVVARRMVCSCSRGSVVRRGVGSAGAKVKITATMTAPAARITRPGWAREPTMASVGFPYRS